MATEGSNAAHEEADHLAPEEGGGPWTAPKIATDAIIVSIVTLTLHA